MFNVYQTVFIEHCTSSTLILVDFGKLPSVDHVDFSLPPALFPDAVFNGLADDKILTTYVGATGYNMKSWVGKWYPAGARERDFLLHYGRQFNTIEHNTTHYRIPDAATVARWVSDTPDDFRFCPKIPQTISHARDLGLQSGQIPLFAAAVQALGNRLGCCFMQLPPYVDLRHQVVIAKFLEHFPAEIPLALEFRHPAFFEPSAEAADFFRFLSHKNITAVITDVAGRRDVCHMVRTTSTAMIRFVGNGLHPSDYTRIQAWVQRLAQWHQEGMDKAYFFTHEPDNLLAPDLAAYFTEQLRSALPEVHIRGPRLEQTPRQGVLW